LTDELKLGPGDSNELAVLIPSRPALRAQPTRLIGIIVKDIQLANAPDEPCFGPGRKSGVLVFQREPAVF
jgi:hypothetical protein